MKRTLVYICIIFTFIFLLLFKLKNTPVLSPESPKQEILSDENTAFEINEYDIENYRLIIANVTGYENTAIPNFENKFLSEEIMEKFNCNILINGSMYDKNYQPLGIYYSNGITLGKLKNNSFMNGIISIDEENKFKIAEISKFNFDDPYKYYIQTGPIYIMNGKPFLTDLKDDHARRIILLTNNKNELFVIVVMDKDNYSDGPTFRKTSDILFTVQNMIDLDIKDAINLDGGNASLFIGQKYSIKESEFAGSFLCFKK